jgi:hypothetical protein
MAAVGVAFAVTRLGSRVGGRVGPYSAIVWLPLGDSRAQARLVRAQCGSVPGAAAVSGISRSRAGRTAGEFVFSVKMRWGPDDTRSNPLMGCLDNNPRIDHYVIPI